MKLVGLLGGTFNPIHFGHLRMAQEIADALQIDEVRFVPSANPPHKAAPVVSANQRADMVQIAIESNPLFKLDTRELNRAGASYTIDTLVSLREELGENVTLCLIMGSDAFTKLNTWHRWHDLLNYCHIILVQRPKLQDKLSDVLTDYLQTNYSENLDDLANKSHGYIHMQATTAQDISATNIRKVINQGDNPQYLLPDSVLTYIRKNKLYLQVD